MPGTGSTHPLRVSTRMLMLSSAFVAASIGWSAHWSDCKYHAVFHQTLANAERQARPGESAEILDRKRRNAEWHEEMRRRFERAAWIPWPGSTAEPPRP